MSVMMSLEPDLVYTTSNTIVPAVEGVSGHYIANFSAKDKIADPISVQYEEVYRLSMPEIVGFAQQATVAGEAQNLNLRLPRRAYANFSKGTTGDADPDHTDYDNQNPALPIEDGLPD